MPHPSQFYSLGAQRSPQDHRDYRVMAPPPGQIHLPARYDLGPYAPPVMNQGAEGSCVGQAARVLLNVAAAKAGTSRDLSARWVYEQARKLDPSPGEGTYPRAAFKAMNAGTCYATDWPYEAGKRGEPGPLAAKHAPLSVAVSYAQVTPGQEPIKTAILSAGLPALIVINVRDGFYTPDDQGVTKNEGEAHGLHALPCLGWSEQGLIVQNSWGEDWGNRGRAILAPGVQVEEAWIGRFAFTAEHLAPPDFWAWLRSLWGAR